MEKLEAEKRQSMSIQDGKAKPRVTIHKGFSLARFFGFSKTAIRSSFSDKPLSPEILKVNQKVSSLPENDSHFKWMLEEEKVLQEYQAALDAGIKRSASSLEHDPASAFSTQSITASPFIRSKSKGSSLSPKKIFGRLGILALGLGWIAAGILTYSYWGETNLQKNTLANMISLQNTNQRLRHDYSGLKSLSANQHHEIQRLNLQIRQLAGEVRDARGKIQWFQMMEQPYREEMLRLTMRYEEQLALMRKLVSTRDEIVLALKAQVQAVEKMMDEGIFVAARKGKASPGEQEAAFLEPAPGFECKVVSINSRYKTILINKGSDQGLRSGQRLVLVKGGEWLTEGIADRVYPNTASLLIRDQASLEKIQENDDIFFSTEQI